MDAVRKIGKSIPLSILARDTEWRRSVGARQGEWLPEFVRDGTPVSACPVCHETGALLAGQIEEVEYRQCGLCSHLFCGISPSPRFLDAYYQSDNSAQRMTYLEISPEIKSDRQSQISSEKAVFISEVVRRNTPDFNNRAPLWVDVGSGVGELLLAAKALGYEVHGFEPDEAQAEESMGRGIPTTSTFITPMAPIPEVATRADVISLLNLLEHTVLPSEFLSHLTGGSRTGSFLALEVPRHPSLSSVIQLSGFYPSHRHIYPPEHLQIFSETSITKLLVSCSYELRGIWVFGSDALEVFAGVRDSFGEGGRFDDPMVRQNVDKFQQSVDVFGLSDNMLLVAQKVRPRVLDGKEQGSWS